MRFLAGLWLCLVLATPVGGSRPASAHDFYVSFTVVSYNADTQNLEVIHRLFTDDLARAVTNDPMASVDAATEPLVSTYLQETFRIKGAPLSWVGMESDADTTLVYWESPMPDPPAELTITNTVLFGFFQQQINSVNIEVSGQIRALSFIEMLQEPRTKTAVF